MFGAPGPSCPAPPVNTAREAGTRSPQVSHGRPGGGRVSTVGHRRLVGLREERDTVHGRGCKSSVTGGDGDGDGGRGRARHGRALHGRDLCLPGIPDGDGWRGRRLDRRRGCHAIVARVRGAAGRGLPLQLSLLDRRQLRRRGGGDGRRRWPLRQLWRHRRRRRRLLLRRLRHRRLQRACTSLLPVGCLPACLRRRRHGRRQLPVDSVGQVGTGRLGAPG